MNKIRTLLLNCILTDIKRTLDLIMVEFKNVEEEIVCIHVQTFLRVLNEQKIIIASNDLYKPKDEYSEDFDWTEPGVTLFDEQVEKFKNQLLGMKISTIEISNKDLILNLSDGFTIEMFIDTVRNEEKYRVFILGKEHLVIES